MTDGSGGGRGLFLRRIDLDGFPSEKEAVQIPLASDRLAYNQRKDLLTRLVNQNDVCKLASLHRQHPNGCFLHKRLPCKHRLLECRTFLGLAKPSIAPAIQLEVNSNASTSAHYACGVN